MDLLAEFPERLMTLVVANVAFRSAKAVFSRGTKGDTSDKN